MVYNAPSCKLSLTGPARAFQGTRGLCIPRPPWTIKDNGKDSNERFGPEPLHEFIRETESSTSSRERNGPRIPETDRMPRDWDGQKNSAKSNYRLHLPLICSSFDSITATMSRVIDVSSRLGEYMLSGWVSTPIIRSFFFTKTSFNILRF